MSVKEGITRITYTVPIVWIIGWLINAAVKFYTVFSNAPDWTHRPAYWAEGWLSLIAAVVGPIVLYALIKLINWIIEGFKK